MTQVSGFVRGRCRFAGFPRHLRTGTITAGHPRPMGPQVGVDMGRFVLSVSAAAMVMLCVVVASGQNPPAKDGEAIMNSACGSCHDTTSIQVSARSEQEWNATIEQMIARGASLSDADR